MALSIIPLTGIPIESADKIRKDLAERNRGEVFSAVEGDMIDVFSICGSPDQCVEQIDRLFEMGIIHFIMGSPLGPSKKKPINLFGNEVVPHFKES